MKILYDDRKKNNYLVNIGYRLSWNIILYKEFIYISKIIRIIIQGSVVIKNIMSCFDTCT